MTEKNQLHTRNKHQGEYNFEELINVNKELEKFVALNKFGKLSIDFFNPEAVKTLNKSLLMYYYDIQSWDVPKGYLCPPIPGRADYIHNIADLIGVEKNSNIKCLDIGVGANCIYPIIGCKEYDWSFVGTEIDPKAIDNAKKIIENNPSLKGKIELRLQTNSSNIFRGIIGENDRFDVSICNPPFHSSAEAAQKGTLRKLSALKGRKVTKPTLNFSGQESELWCEGGEIRFIVDMIDQSRQYKNKCRWFTTLVSKDENLPRIYAKLAGAQTAESHTIPMQQGNKITRIVAWHF